MGVRSLVVVVVLCLAGTAVTTRLTPCDGDASWSLLEGDCYKAFSGEMTWNESRVMCKQKGGDLTSISTLELNLMLQAMVSDMTDDDFWIGGRVKHPGGYEWVDGEPFTFANWAPAEPDEVDDPDACMSMYRPAGTWGDQNGGLRAGYICKRPSPQQSANSCPSDWVPVGSMCLVFNTVVMNFTTSRAACQLLGSGADLISVHSQDDQAHLLAALGVVQENMWLGLAEGESGGFSWVDQTNMDFSNWDNGEPNGEGCVEIKHESGFWNDISCSEKRGHICMLTQDTL